MSRSVGGSARETVESIKYFAPKAIQIQDRAVVANDFKILLKNKFPEITAISVYGGEEVDPPQFGRTIISLAVNDMDGFSENVRQRCLAFLKDRCVLAVEPVIASPEYMYISVHTDVKYDQSKTGVGAGSVHTMVDDAIKDFTRTNLNDFGQTLRTSKLIGAIDDSFNKIVSNETHVRAIIQFRPSLDSQNKYEIYFKNELFVNKYVAAGDEIADYTPSVQSSAFAISEQTGYLMDDGRGVLNFIRNVNTTFTYIKKAVGAVDYKTGKITLNKADITSFTGAGIEFSVLPKYSDIVSPKSRIIKIRDTDITISVAGVHGG
jgi:hypothetical protein